MTGPICRNCGKAAEFLVADPLGGGDPIPACPLCFGKFVRPAQPAPFSNPSISLDEIKNRKFDLIARWTCHVCGKERPDDKIAVFKRDIGVDYGLPEGTLTQNVRHCTDDPDCVEKAKDFNFFK